MAALLVIALVGVAALSIDAGRAFYRRFQIQAAADAAVLAAAIPLARTDVTDAIVTAEAQQYADRNAIDSTFILDGIECGIWVGEDKQFHKCTTNGDGSVITEDKKNPTGNLSHVADAVSGTLTNTCLECSDLATNAIRVFAHYNEPTIFGKLFNVGFLSPHVKSTAIFIPGDFWPKPFGILSNVIDSNWYARTNVTVRKNSPGNWGKVDIGLVCLGNPNCDFPGNGKGQLAGLPEFRDMMTYGVHFTKDPKILQADPNLIDPDTDQLMIDSAALYPLGAVGGVAGYANAVQGFAGLQPGPGLKNDEGTQITEDNVMNLREYLCGKDPRCTSEGGPVMVLPVVDHTYNGGFPNGNSGRVKIVRWTEVAWLAYNELSGNNWEAIFRIINPDYRYPNTIVPARKLVE